MNIRKLMEKIRELPKEEIEEKMEELEELTENMLYCIKKYNIEKFKKYSAELHEIACGKVVTEEMSYDWVSNMLPFGEKWSIDETTEILKNHNLQFDDIEFYVIMNELYNKYHNTINDDVNVYIKLAKNEIDFLNNKEHGFYKIYKIDN